MSVYWIAVAIALKDADFMCFIVIIMLKCLIIKHIFSKHDLANQKMAPKRWHIANYRSAIIALPIM